MRLIEAERWRPTGPPRVVESRADDRGTWDIAGWVVLESGYGWVALCCCPFAGEVLLLDPDLGPGFCRTIYPAELNELGAAILRGIW